MDWILDGPIRLLLASFSWRFWLCMALAAAGFIWIDHAFAGGALKTTLLIVFGLAWCVAAVRWEGSHQRRCAQQRRQAPLQ